MANDGVRVVLEGGTTMAGRGFGASRAVAGEVVFNTAMVGYVEALRRRDESSLAVHAWQDYRERLPVALD